MTTQPTGLLLRWDSHPLGECCCELQLPSTGVTRLPRYYEPLRHTERPGLALAGLRLSSRDSPLGASRVASDLRVQTCHRQYPGGTLGACRVVRGIPLSPRTAAFPI